MKLFLYSAALATFLFGGSALLAQSSNEGRQEIAITAGELSSGAPSVPGDTLNLNAGVAVGVNLAHKVRDLGFGSLYWEIEGLTGPLRYVSGTPVTASHSIHSLYLTPGLKLQFMPKEALSPFLAAGAGYALYNSSSKSIAGGATSGGTVNTYAIDFGGGVDYSFGKRFAVRAEVRGFYTGNPNFGTPSNNGLFNFVVNGGLVWRSK